MNKEDLTALREIFRKRMREEDFCIGEEKVEALFRELLGEPEPHPAIVHLTMKQYEDVKRIVSIEMDRIAPKLKELFEKDDTFYKRMKR